ncbi:MAG TPA: HVO_0476 family zinc finger protein [Methanomassiliicoccales archaeon]|nr:HVO_0476 family zinc finger protein [Methanomassiliicoccales archaeon]
MAIPNSIYLECPNCGEKTLHEVLRGKISKGGDVLETTVKCQKCGTVHSAVVREPRAVSVPIIVSEMGQSRRFSFEFGGDELVSVGDELFVGDANVVVTSIEKNSARVQSAPAGEISTIWAKRYDSVRVKISVNKTSKTLAAEITALPDEEFYVGDTFTVGKDEVVIHTIKTKTGTVRSGGAAARDIIRIYAKCMRITYG